MTTSKRRRNAGKRLRPMRGKAKVLVAAAKTIQKGFRNFKKRKTAAIVKQAVKDHMSMICEKKMLLGSYSIQMNPTISWSNFHPLFPNTIVKGINQYNRIGDSVQMKSLTLKIMVTLNDPLNTVDTANYEHFGRFLEVYKMRFMIIRSKEYTNCWEWYRDLQTLNSTARANVDNRLLEPTTDQERSAGGRQYSGIPYDNFVPLNRELYSTHFTKYKVLCLPVRMPDNYPGETGTNATKPWPTTSPFYIEPHKHRAYFKVKFGPQVLQFAENTTAVPDQSGEVRNFPWLMCAGFAPDLDLQNWSQIGYKLNVNFTYKLKYTDV